MIDSSNWISVADTAILLKVRTSTVIRRIEKGVLPARTPEEMPFTYDGKSNYEVRLDALPQRLQYQYLFAHLPKQDICSVDLVSPRSALGNIWLDEFLDIASIIHDATVIRQNHHSTGKITEELRSLADRHGISLATLYRLLGKPSSDGVSALYTDPFYLRDHLPRTMCLWSCDLAFALFLDSSSRTDRRKKSNLLCLAFSNRQKQFFRIKQNQNLRSKIRCMISPLPPLWSKSQTITTPGNPLSKRGLPSFSEKTNMKGTHNR